MVLLGQDSNLYGGLRVIDMQQQYFAADFPKQCSSKQMSEPCQMTLFDLSQYQIYLSSAVLARIFPRLDLEPELMEFVEACFLRDSDFYDLKSFRLSSLKTYKGFSAAVTAQTSKKSSQRLGNWGMWGVGNSETGGDGCPKTAAESSLLVISGNVQCRRIEPDRPSLQSCLDSDGVVINSVNGKPIDESLTLKANSHKAGTGNSKHPAAVVESLNEKAESLLAVVYRGAAGDRTYIEEAPTLRSLANTGGKHQGGSGAWKVVEYKGEEYLVESGGGDEACTLYCNGQLATNRKRPMNLKTGKLKDLPYSYRGNPRPLTATEFERLMGWPVGCTEKGITRDGQEITISKTQRQKMLGNGIVPQEIEDICNKLKDFLVPSYLDLPFNRDPA